ncbi:MAG: Hsp70 family protein [Bacteroidetes bacterium]|nr:Hsp70 family protein [Bacteroidota bacterium]
MSGTINFGIDLGTTNSLIARSANGSIEIFKNPSGLKNTLPSVVAFRKERVLIGDKAREYVEKDPQNVLAGFKRKMGTGESFFIPNIAAFKTPIELSAFVLQELRTFIYTGESPLSVVITIPASFDTVQSNATKQAGYEAGFKEVVLLQEPIAASLAFANKSAADNMEGQWLVYDLGGGTFDVALVKIVDEEMKVVDHEGDNFLGGLDFDALIVTRLIVPYLEKQYGLSDLAADMQSARGNYNKLYYKLLYKAEEAKIALSARPDTEIEFEFTDAAGEEHEVVFTLTRSDFENIIRERIDYSIRFIQKILDRNQLSSSDIKEVVLVGGSTYIPLVRQLIPQQLGIGVNFSVDPTTAVAEGAAYYAGGKTKHVADNATAGATAVSTGDAPAAPAQPEGLPTNITVKTAYQKSSREKEEYFTAIIANAPAGTTYRITREDGGYDSGIKPASERISEMLYLLPNTLNVFRLRLYNQKQQLLGVTVPDIAIVQGKFSIYGQPLPNDICLEVDDAGNNTTRLELIFEKNALLPIKKTITKTLSRTIAKGSDDQLIINVLEGSRYASPQSNLPIGIIGIHGKELKTDLIKGSDVDLTIEISESRDITITAYISMIDQEYKHAFSPTVRNVNIERMRDEVDYLIRVGKRNLDQLVNNEDYESGTEVQSALERLEGILAKLKKLRADDVTDLKYQLDDEKRKLAEIIDRSGKEQLIVGLKEDYFLTKENCQHYLSRANNPSLQKRFEELTRDEHEWLSYNSSAFIRRKIYDLNHLSWDIRRRDISYVTQLYLYYAMQPDEAYRDQQKIAQLRKRGDEALERKVPEEILSIVSQMYELLIDKDRDEMMKGTGLNG